MNMFSIILALLVIGVLAGSFGAYQIYAAPLIEKKSLDNKISYLNSLVATYKKVDETTKQLIYLDTMKDIEIAKYSKLAEAYKNSTVNILSTDPDAIADQFGAKSGASVGQFMKAIQLVTGASMDDIAKQVADKMKKE